MIFLRQKYKQKPKQWGPVATVLSVVYDRIGNMGIPSRSISACLPLWYNGRTELDYSTAIWSVNGATKSKGIYSFDGVDDEIIGNKRIFPERKATIILKDLVFNTTGSFARVLHSCVDTSNSNLSGVYFQKTSTGQLELTYTNGATASLSARKSFTTNSYVGVNNRYDVAGIIRDGINNIIIILNNNVQPGAYSGTATTYSSGTGFPVIGVLEYGGTKYFGNISLAGMLCFDTDLSISQTEQLTDGFWELFQPPVFRSYFIPSGETVSPINCNLLAAASQATRIIQ